MLERFHLSHVLNYQHLAWSDVTELDEQLAGLGFTLCIITAQPEAIRRRLDARDSDWLSFLRETGQRNHLRGELTSGAATDYFVRQQHGLLELATRSVLTRVEIDTTVMRPCDAAENLLRAVLEPSTLPVSERTSPSPRSGPRS